MENGFGFGPTFYSGSPVTYLTPMIGSQFAFFSSVLWNRYLNWSNRFDLGFLVMGSRIAKTTLMYNGITGQYMPSIRVNFAKKGVVPYVEGGGALGIFALYCLGTDSDTARSQTALKYGYSIGTGFDSVGDRGRGSEGGWGISVLYFNFLPSADSFEFAAGAVSAMGVKLDIKFLFSSGSKR